MNPVRQSWALLTGRYLRQLYRQPAVIGITLTQPVIWLLLFGALFKKVAELPGFGGGSYITYLTPGVVIIILFGAVPIVWSAVMPSRARVATSCKSSASISARLAGSVPR